MGKIDTRAHIIETAITQYNAHGYSNVSIKDIADILKVDRRNVSYHFDKKELLAVIAEQMWRELDDVRIKKKDFPSFENLDKEVRLYNRLQQSYAFIFQDLNVIEHPLIHKKFKSFCQTLIADSKQAVAFAIQQGNMHPESVAGSYNAICTAVWTISFSSLQLKSLRGIRSHEDIRKIIWSLIVPHFTDKGLSAFKLFYGQDFLDTLGQPFDTKVNTLMF